ncbi:farnesol dehydrogenase [Episyrphus balteatus]|uniref:farnesol dehydrogenase n=1 Tax=Episyrphus balteatus TaxID=286459 RepID=UPI0024864AB9|nr:farnesol dehydrogenase [Episyrphus balteatus]
MAAEFWRNRVAVVTGASTGIGAEVCVTLANNYMVVVGLARRTQLIEDLNTRVTGLGKIFAIECDLTDTSSIVNAFEQIKAKFHTVHLLVNGAGRTVANFLLESSAGEVRDVFDLNVVAACTCIMQSVELMKIHGLRSHIIIINSILGHKVMELPKPAYNVYPATKHALTALCQTVRQEIRYNKLNVKLTSISPGMVETDFLKVYNPASYAPYPKLQPKDVADAVVYALHTPPNVQIEEIILQAIPEYKKEEK